MKSFTQGGHRDELLLTLVNGEKESFFYQHNMLLVSPHRQQRSDDATYFSPSIFSRGDAPASEWWLGLCANYPLARSEIKMDPVATTCCAPNPWHRYKEIDSNIEEWGVPAKSTVSGVLSLDPIRAPNQCDDSLHPIRLK